MSGEIAANKVYDRTTTATLSGGTLAGVIAGETVTLNHAGDFVSRNAGTGIAVTASDSLGGIAASNYVLTQPTGLTADITPKALTLAGLTAANKVYDGNTSASITSTSLSGVITGDAVSTSIGSASFDTKNVGTAKTVTAAGIGLTGVDAANYGLASTTGTTLADITAKALTVSGEIAANKVYDRTTTATLSGGTLAGVIAGETVTLNHAGDFVSRNAGTGIAVTASDSLGGIAASNYVLTQPTGLTADITPKALTLAGLTAANKVYDGNTSASITSTSLSGVITGDAVSTSIGSASFDTKNVGTAKTVTAAGIGLTGANAGNYALGTTSATTTANITAKPLSITGFASANKVYDRTTAAVITSTGSLSGVVTGDNVGFTNTSATFADSNAGLNKTVTLNGVQLNGTDLANYSYSGITTDLSDITPKLLSINGFLVFNKAYDGNTLANIIRAGTLSGIISGDTVGFFYSNATFDNPAIGINKTVTLNGVTLNGDAALNYLYTGPTTTRANIRK